MDVSSGLLDAPFHEDLQASDEPFQTQQVIAVSRDVYLVQDDIRRALRLGVPLLTADDVLLRGLEDENGLRQLTSYTVSSNVHSVH